MPRTSAVTSHPSQGKARGATRCARVSPAANQAMNTASDPKEPASGPRGHSASAKSATPSRAKSKAVSGAIGM